MAGTDKTFVEFAYPETVEDFDAEEVIDRTIAKMGLEVEQ
jgi:hypothetical protein